MKSEHPAQSDADGSGPQDAHDALRRSWLKFCARLDAMAERLIELKANRRTKD